jgi:TFIIF-interacting CTD phosphatase-like protein
MEIKRGNKSALMVLDIDQTLLCTLSADDPIAQSVKQRSHKLNFGEGVDLVTIIRPGAKEFVQYVHKHFRKVVIWTAAQREYAEKVLKIIYGNNEIPDLLSFENCYDHHDYITKPLITLAEKYNFYQNMVIIVDDSDTSTMLNKNNRVAIPAYVPVTGSEEEDRALYKLMKFFDSPKFTSQIYPAAPHISEIEW